MTNRRKKTLVYALLAAVLLCSALVILESQSKPFRRFLDEALLDNKNHYLPCQQLPTLAEVENAIAAHQDVVEQIEQINPGLVGMYIDSTQCPGKADIVIWYGSHQDRLTIESIIDGATFYGIPYRLNNR